MVNIVTLGLVDSSVDMFVLVACDVIRNQSHINIITYTYTSAVTPHEDPKMETKIRANYFFDYMVSYNVS